MEDPRFVNNRFPTFNEVIKDIRTIWTLYHMQVDKRIEQQLKSLLYDFKKRQRKLEKQELMLNASHFYFLIFALVSAKYRK